MADTSSSAVASLATIPDAALNGDIGIAAGGSASEGFGYVGVWVKDVATCAVLGTDAAKDFAVITTSTFRDGPSAAFGNFGPLADGKVTLNAAGRAVALAQTDANALTIDGASYVRCTP